MSRQEQAQDGSPFGPSVEQATRGIWSADLFASLLGVLVSPGRGLLVYQPWLLLALAPLVPRLRRRPNVARSPEPRGWVACCVAVIALYLILVSAWSCWWGGHCWGSRLASEVVPLGALPCLRPLTALGSAPAGRR